MLYREQPFKMLKSMAVQYHNVSPDKPPLLSKESIKLWDLLDEFIEVQRHSNSQEDLM
jgi:hypothetical protein